MSPLAQLGYQGRPGGLRWRLGGLVAVYMTGPAKGRQIVERIRRAARFQRLDMMDFQAAYVATIETPPAITLEARPSGSCPAFRVQTGVKSASGVSLAHCVETDRPGSPRTALIGSAYGLPFTRQ